MSIAKRVAIATSATTAAVLPVLLCAALCDAATAQSFRVTVKARDDIYLAGQTNLGPFPPYLGYPPPSVTLPVGAQCIIVRKFIGNGRCASSEGCVTLDYDELEGTHYNDPDGVGAAPRISTNTGTSSTSGIKARYAGYLVGLFTPAGGPNGPAPAALNFLKGKRTAFEHLAPKLDQTFFIGDGLTGDGTGTKQRFSVSATAATLYLGISDASGFKGPPGAYGDNKYAFTVFVHASPDACHG